MKKRLSYLPFPVITLILELLPYGAVCNFANPNGAPWRKTYSYFNLIPYGYANFAPLITAVLTCIVLVLLFVFLLTGKHRIISVAKILLCVDTVLSLCPLLLGIHFFSVVGALITATLIAELCLLFFAEKTTSK